MSNEKALVVVPQRQVTLDTVQTAQTIAKMAGMFGLQPDQAAIAMLTGYELGFGLVTSLRYIDVIKTSSGLQPALRAQAMEALINRSGVLDEFKVTDHADKKGPSGCTVYMKRTIGDMVKEYSAIFTREDAERAELLGKHNWQHYPVDMYYNRALSRCARRVCADVVLGLYTPDELGADEGPTEQWSVVSPDPNEKEPPTQGASKPVSPPIKADTPKDAKNAPEAPSEASESEPGAESEAKSEESPKAKIETGDNGNLDLSALVAKGYTPAQIMAANNGRIPGTSEECKAVLEKLEAGDA